MRNEDGERAGRFFLKSRGKKRVWYICWYDSATGQTDGFSTRTADFEAARKQLLEHALTEQRPAPTGDIQLATVMQAYFIHYAQHLPSAAAQRAAQRDALEIWGDINISALLRTKQLELVNTLRARGLSDWTIDGRLNRVWASMSWFKRDNPTLAIPDQITAEDWKPILEDRDHTYSLEELAALFDTASEPVTESRYTRDHWWRFLVLAVATASREAALRELTWSQINERIGRIRLNPQGRRQTKKRRATVPIAPTLAAELASWSRNGEHVITYYGRPLATPEFFDLLAARAGVSGGPNVIRHTVRTWLAEFGVPDVDADVFMGHRPEGSATSRRYIHRKPEYLQTVVVALEALFEEVNALMQRPFKGREMADQPPPNVATHVASFPTALARFSQVTEESGDSGAGNETRTRDLNLGKTR